VRGLGEYQGTPKYETRVYHCLVGLLQQDPDPEVRGEAASYLGDSPRAEVEIVLQRALEDKETINLDTNQSADKVDSVSTRAQESLRRLAQTRSESSRLQ
jgi:hypothetical protein